MNNKTFDEHSPKEYEKMNINQFGVIGRIKKVTPKAEQIKIQNQVMRDFVKKRVGK